MQALKAAPSSRHWSEVPASDENAKLAEVTLIGPEGPELIVVSGAIESSR